VAPLVEFQLAARQGPRLAEALALAHVARTYLDARVPGRRPHRAIDGTLRVLERALRRVARLTVATLPPPRVEHLGPIHGLGVAVRGAWARGVRGALAAARAHEAAGRAARAAGDAVVARRETGFATMLRRLAGRLTRAARRLVALVPRPVVSRRQPELAL